jgi:hypothetical protein
MIHRIPCDVAFSSWSAGGNTLVSKSKRIFAKCLLIRRFSEHLFGCPAHTGPIVTREHGGGSNANQKEHHHAWGNSAGFLNHQKNYGSRKERGYYLTGS